MNNLFLEVMGDQYPSDRSSFGVDAPHVGQDLSDGVGLCRPSFKLDHHELPFIILGCNVDPTMPPRSFIAVVDNLESRFQLLNVDAQGALKVSFEAELDLLWVVTLRISVVLLPGV